MSTGVVVDASALVAAIQGRGRAVAVLDAGDLHAPDLLIVETAGALRALERAGALSPATAAAAADGLGALAIRLEPHGSLVAGIWALRHELSAYDAAYLALADLGGHTLATADEGLAACAERHLGAARVVRVA